MSRPPFAERLLLGFLTDPALGDAILGDLTATIAFFRELGLELAGEVVRYQDAYRLLLHPRT